MRSFLISVILLANAASAQVTLRLVDWADLDEMPSDKAAIAAFREKYPGIDVLYEPNPGHQYEEKILTGLAAGEPPDVFLLDSKLIPTFTDKAALLDLTPYLAKLKIDTSEWFSSAVDIARRGAALYAFPKGFSPLVVYYNRKIFREAGVEPPSGSWTWDEYLSTARRLTRTGPSLYGTAMTNYYAYWIPWVWSSGGDVVDPGGTAASGYFNSPRTEEALEFLIKLRWEGLAPDAGSWVQSEKTGTNSALFASGKIAMIVDGHWRMPKFLKLSEAGGELELGVAPFPSHPGGRKTNVLYESGWCVPVNARHVEEAVLLAGFMAGETSCRIRSAGGLELPANRAAASDLARNDRTGREKVFIDEIPSCRQPWGSLIERFSELEWTFQDAVDDIMLNHQPVHATLTRYAERADRELAAIRTHRPEKFSPISQHSEIIFALLGVSALTLLACALLYLRERKGGTIRAFAFLLPSLIHLVVFIGTPILFAAYLSVRRWDLVASEQPFIGLENFREIFSDPTFWNALRNTFLYTLNVPIGMAAALAVALALQNRLGSAGLLRTLFFLPSVTSFVAVALVWMWIYHPSFGAANYLLSSLGFPPLQWLNSSGTAMVSLLIFSIWLGIGYQMVIFLAGLQAIPETLYDAARIDGASGFRRFMHITLPLLNPTTFFILVTSCIGSFQVFTTVYVMTAGGPVRSTDVIVYHIYEAAWEQLRMGYAAAMSWVLFFIIMIATWVQFRLMGKEMD